MLNNNNSQSNTWSSTGGFQQGDGPRPSPPLSMESEPWLTQQRQDRLSPSPSRHRRCVHDNRPSTSTQLQWSSSRSRSRQRSISSSHQRNACGWTFYMQSGDIVHRTNCITCMKYTEHRAYNWLFVDCVDVERIWRDFFLNQPGPSQDNEARLHRELVNARRENDDLRDQLRRAEDWLHSWQQWPLRPRPELPSESRLPPRKRARPTDRVTTTKDTVPLSDRIALDFVGQPLGFRLSTNPAQAPPLGVIDLIDFNIEDGEIPIPTMSSQRDTQPELMPVVPFIVQDANTVFNGVDYIRMGQGYNQHCIENVAMGLQPPVGTLSFPGGRGPMAHDPQDLQQVQDLMNQISRYQRRPDIIHASEFIGQIHALWWTRQGGYLEHHQAALDRWEAMSARIRNTQSSEGRRTINALQNAPSQVSLDSSPSSWSLYIAKNPRQCPIGIRVNYEGIASTIDLGIHLRISRISVHAPKLPKLIKISKDQKQALSWQNNAFYHAVICMLTQEGHYVCNPSGDNNEFKEHEFNVQ
jgi:hypothetical protein